MDKLYVWIAKQKAQHPPKSVMGNAIKLHRQKLANHHALHHQHRQAGRYHLKRLDPRASKAPQGLSVRIFETGRLRRARNGPTE
jgi:hypothetical protein